MTDSIDIFIPTETEMLDLSYRLGQVCPKGMIIYLEGELGAGKTNFARGLLRGLGYQGFVKSPTYTLVEVYSLQSSTAVHMDLYRIGHEEELYYLGITDYLNKNTIFLIEWPEKAIKILPPATLQCQFKRMEEGRHIHFISFSKDSSEWLKKILN